MKSAPRIYALLARGARVGVVFRRGPARDVLLLRWDLTRDEFEPGQWLRARVYERRCDLSPSGDRLVYFAAKWKGTFETYTAISRPPYFTALALWRGFGAWGGGGLFQDEDTLLLNHRAIVAPEAGTLVRRFVVRSIGEWAGYGEDDPIWSARLARDGWTLTEPGRSLRHGHDAKIWVTYEPAIVFTKVQPTKPRLRLEMRLLGLAEKNGSWYVTEHAIKDARDHERATLGRSDWADWDRNGDLLFAKDGRIWRLDAGLAHDPTRARELIDLRGEAFVARKSPAWAREWRGRRHGARSTL